MIKYKLIADTYDLLLSPFLRGLRRQILDIAIELQPGKIADLCCGTGHQMKILKKHGFDNLICVDLSEDMLRTASRGIHAPTCLLSDASETGIDSESIDLVIISLALHEKTVEQAAAVLREAHRILKPGAALVVGDYSSVGSATAYSASIIRFIEFLVGGEHYQNFKEYMRFGGLHELHDESLFTVLKRCPAAAGGMSVEVWEKSPE